MGKRHVTDHAVVRWMERIYGIDMDEVRDEIRGAIEAFSKPNGRQRWEAMAHYRGVTFLAIIQGGTVITIQHPKRVKPKTGSKL
jgi:hypothetical protein